MTIVLSVAQVEMMFYKTRGFTDECEVSLDIDHEPGVVFQIKHVKSRIFIQGDCDVFLDHPTLGIERDTLSGRRAYHERSEHVPS